MLRREYSERVEICQRKIHLSRLRILPKQKGVLCAKKDGTEIHGKVFGSNNNQYNVAIDTEHTRKSHCDCPHANGRIVCKHMVAQFFAAFPKEAEKYKAELDAYYEEEKKRQEELGTKIDRYICRLTKEELKQTVLELLYDGPEWQFEKFVRERIEY